MTDVELYELVLRTNRQIEDLRETLDLQAEEIEQLRNNNAESTTSPIVSSLDPYGKVIPVVVRNSIWSFIVGRESLMIASLSADPSRNKIYTCPLITLHECDDRPTHSSSTSMETLVAISQRSEAILVGISNPGKLRVIAFDTFNCTFTSRVSPILPLLDSTQSLQNLFHRVFRVAENPGNDSFSLLTTSGDKLQIFEGNSTSGVVQSVGAPKTFRSEAWIRSEFSQTLRLVPVRRRPDNRLNYFLFIRGPEGLQCSCYDSSFSSVAWTDKSLAACFSDLNRWNLDLFASSIHVFLLDEEIIAVGFGSQGFQLARYQIQTDIWQYFEPYTDPLTRARDHLNDSVRSFCAFRNQDNISCMVRVSDEMIFYDFIRETTTWVRSSMLKLPQTLCSPLDVFVNAGIPTLVGRTRSEIIAFEYINHRWSDMRSLMTLSYLCGPPFILFYGNNIPQLPGVITNTNSPIQWNIQRVQGLGFFSLSDDLRSIKIHTPGTYEVIAKLYYLPTSPEDHPYLFAKLVVSELLHPTPLEYRFHGYLNADFHQMITITSESSLHFSFPAENLICLHRGTPAAHYLSIRKID